MIKEYLVVSIAIHCTETSDKYKIGLKDSEGNSLNYWPKTIEDFRLFNVGDNVNLDSKLV